MLLRLLAVLSFAAALQFGSLADDGGHLDPNGGGAMDPNGVRLCYTGCVDPNG